MKVVILQRGDDKGWRRRMEHTALRGYTCVRQAVTWPQINLLYWPLWETWQKYESVPWQFRLVDTLFHAVKTKLRCFPPQNTGILEGISCAVETEGSWWYCTLCGEYWLSADVTVNNTETYIRKQKRALNGDVTWHTTAKGHVSLCIHIGCADSSGHSSAPLQDPAFPHSHVVWTFAGTDFYNWKWLWFILFCEKAAICWIWI